MAKDAPQEATSFSNTTINTRLPEHVCCYLKIAPSPFMFSLGVSVTRKKTTTQKGLNVTIHLAQKENEFPETPLWRPRATDALFSFARLGWYGPIRGLRPRRLVPHAPNWRMSCLQSYVVWILSLSLCNSEKQWVRNQIANPSLSAVLHKFRFYTSWHFSS